MIPLLVTFTNSFMSETEIMMTYTTAFSVFDVMQGMTEKFASIVFIPNRVTFEQYSEILFAQPAYMALLLNSVKITLPIVLGNLAVSLLSAYAFTIWNFKYKEYVFFIYVLVMLMPLQAVLVPNFIMADILGIRDSYLAIILPGIFNPFGTFLLRQSLKAMPPVYLEAAKIDGASSLQVFLYVVLPQMKTGIAALFMLNFIDYWNLVEQAVIFIRGYYRQPLSVYLSRIAENRMGLIFAASVIFMLLPLWFLILGQKDLEKGIEMSGVK
jgi:multiple sugar transport system permease protein